MALCGASGVVFTFLLLSSFTEFKEGEIPLTFILVAIIYICQQIYQGITLDNNVSYVTHIVGALVGYILNISIWDESKIEWDEAIKGGADMFGFVVKKVITDLEEKLHEL